MYSFFFFFKQKTAYEMRISDWSSDVCSSDLAKRLHPFPAQFGEKAGGMRDKRRFTGLAALGNRGEEGRIGFYQKPLTGQARRRILKVARVLERHDPRYGDKKTEFQSLVGEILAGGDRKSTRLNSSH